MSAKMTELEQATIGAMKCMSSIAGRGNGEFYIPLPGMVSAAKILAKAELRIKREVAEKRNQGQGKE